MKRLHLAVALRIVRVNRRESSPRLHNGQMQLCPQLNTGMFNSVLHRQPRQEQLGSRFTLREAHRFPSSFSTPPLRHPPPKMLFINYSLSPFAEAPSKKHLSFLSCHSDSYGLESQGRQGFTSSSECLSTRGVSKAGADTFLYPKLFASAATKLSLLTRWRLSSVQDICDSVGGVDCPIAKGVAV